MTDLAGWRRARCGLKVSPNRGPEIARRLCCSCSSGLLGNVRGGGWCGGCGGGLERAGAHDGGTAVEDAGRGQGQGQVAGEGVEQSGPRREDGRVDDEEVLVDQAGCVGQRTEGPGTEGGDDVGAVLLLELPQVLDGIA